MHNEGGKQQKQKDPATFWQFVPTAASVWGHIRPSGSCCGIDACFKSGQEVKKWGNYGGNIGPKNVIIVNNFG